MNMKGFNKEVDYKSLHQASTNYRGETNFCSVIAFAITMGCSFGKARGVFKHFINRKDGAGTWKHDVHPLYIKYGKRLEEKFFHRGFTLKTAARRLPQKGTFLVYSSRHVTCIRDGINQDWSATSVRTKRMIQVFEVLEA